MNELKGKIIPIIYKKPYKEEDMKGRKPNPNYVKAKEGDCVGCGFDESGTFKDYIKDGKVVRFHFFSENRD